MSSFVRSTFLQRFSFRRFLSVDARGIETWGEVETAACRAQPGRKLVRDSAGEQLVVNLVLFTEAELTERDLVWPPGTTPPEDPEDTSGSLKPLLVSPHTQLLSAAVDHYEVNL